MVGRLDGENAIKNGDGFMFNKINDWKVNSTIQNKFPKVGDYIKF